VTLNLVKKKILAIATIGVGSWIIAGEFRELVNKFVPDGSLWIKLIVAIVLIFVGIKMGD